MLQMPGVVSSLPPLEADAFHMAKTDDDFHLKCPTEFARGDYPPLSLAARRPPTPDRLGPYVLRPLVAVPSATSKTYKSLLLAVSSSTINKPSEYIILKLPPFLINTGIRPRLFREQRLFADLEADAARRSSHGS
jgi:hypothetical protein